MKLKAILSANTSLVMHAKEIQSYEAQNGERQKAGGRAIE